MIIIYLILIYNTHLFFILFFIFFIFFLFLYFTFLIKKKYL